MNAVDLLKLIDRVRIIKSKRNNPFNIKMIWFGGFSDTSTWYRAKRIEKVCDLMDFTDWRIPNEEEWKWLNNIGLKQYKDEWHKLHGDWWCSDDDGSIYAKAFYLSLCKEINEIAVFNKSQSCGIALIR